MVWQALYFIILRFRSLNLVSKKDEFFYIILPDSLSTSVLVHY